MYQSHFISCELHSIPALSWVLFLILALSQHHAIISDISTPPPTSNIDSICYVHPSDGPNSVVATLPLNVS